MFAKPIHMQTFVSFTSIYQTHTHTQRNCVSADLGVCVCGACAQTWAVFHAINEQIYSNHLNFVYLRFSRARGPMPDAVTHSHTKLFWEINMRSIGMICFIVKSSSKYKNKYWSILIGLFYFGFVCFAQGCHIYYYYQRQSHTHRNTYWGITVNNTFLTKSGTYLVRTSGREFFQFHGENL